MEPQRPQRHIEVALGIIVQRSRILICRRRPKDSFGGLWEFPGGKREVGESLTQAVCRELKEELDIEVEPGPHLTIIEHSYSTVSVRLNPILCRLIAGEPRPIECSEVAWATQDQLAHYEFPAANAALIAQLMALELPDYR